MDKLKWRSNSFTKIGYFCSDTCGSMLSSVLATSLSSPVLPVSGTFHQEIRKMTVIKKWPRPSLDRSGDASATIWAQSLSAHFCSLLCNLLSWLWNMLRSRPKKVEKTRPSSTSSKHANAVLCALKELLSSLIKMPTSNAPSQVITSASHAEMPFSWFWETDFCSRSPMELVKFSFSWAEHSS